MDIDILLHNGETMTLENVKSYATKDSGSLTFSLENGERVLFPAGGFVCAYLPAPAPGRISVATVDRTRTR